MRVAAFAVAAASIAYTSAVHAFLLPLTCGVSDGEVVTLEPRLLLHDQHCLLRHAELRRHHCKTAAAAANWDMNPVTRW
jgi:hypothetical protein